MTATKTPKLIVGTAELNKAIDSVVNRGKKLDDSIQLLGLSLLDHTDKHGDITLMNRLLLSFPKGSRRNAFAEWALAYGKFILNTDASKKEMPFLFGKDKTTNMALATENVWTEFKPEQELDKAFDFQAQLMALLKKADKADQTKLVGTELLAEVRKLAVKQPA